MALRSEEMETVGIEPTQDASRRIREIDTALKRGLWPWPGVIYFIKAGVCRGPVKIGYTRDPDTRRKTLQAGNPCRLYVAATIPGDMGRERRLHDRFAAGRLEGEWFAPETPGLEDFMSDALHFMGFPDDLESLASKAVLYA